MYGEGIDLRRYAISGSSEPYRAVVIVFSNELCLTGLLRDRLTDGAINPSVKAKEKSSLRHVGSQTSLSLVSGMPIAKSGHFVLWASQPSRDDNIRGNNASSSYRGEG